MTALKSLLASRERAVLLATLVFLLALPPVADALDRGFYVSLFTRILIFGLAAVSLDLILGFGGLVSFGHAAFVGIGAYGVGILFFHQFEGSTLLGLPGSVNALVVWPVAVLASALAALAIGAICLRTSGIGFIMITLAFAQMVYFLFVSLQGYGGDDGIALWGRSQLPGPIDLNDNTSFYYLVLALLLGFLFLCYRLINARFGMVLRGCKENERRMRALGFPTYRYKLAAFVVAGAGAGLSGVLLANATEYVGPAFMVWNRSGEIIVMVVLGGMGTLVGPVFGAATLLLLEEVLADYTEHWQVVLGPLLLLVVLFARRGVYGLIQGRPSGALRRPRRPGKPGTRGDG
ncbi:MAG: branched-chain amino acid ABC transporter permease [Inquilinus sp.]|nr:branched-chain amino acid ABC transporter permease [Inquilinus sp.]